MSRKEFPLLSRRQLVLASAFGVLLAVMWITTRDMDFVIPFVFSFSVIIAEIFAPCIRGFRFSRVVRYPIFFIPYFLPVFLVGIPATLDGNIFLGFSLGIILGCILLLIQFGKIELLLSDDAIELAAPRSPQIIPFIVSGIFNIFSSIGQEVFYRAYMLPTLAQNISIFSILVTAFLFTFEHYLNRWATATYENRDYAILFMIGCTLGLLFSLTGSIIGCISAHMLYNSPKMIQQYKIYKKGKERQSTPDTSTGQQSPEAF